MYILKSKVRLLLTTLAAAFLLLVPAGIVHAADPCVDNPSSSACAACQGVVLTGGTCADTDPTTGKSTDSVGNTIKLVINILSMIVGIAAVIMIIIGGFKYITSSGDSNNINSAKNTILYAVIGLVVVALAQVLVRFVLTKATNATNAPPPTP